MTNKTQKIYTVSSNIIYTAGSNVALPLLYTTGDGENNLSGLTLNIHYDSSSLTPSGNNNGVSNQITASIQSSVLVNDTNDLDSNPLTDKIIRLAWGSFDSSFPGVDLPAAAATITFETSTTSIDPLTGQTYSTAVNYIAHETAPGYEFIAGSTTLEVNSFNLDVDGDGTVGAYSDGLMIMRKLMGTFPNSALTDKALSPGATRSTSEIHQYIQDGINSGLLDIDKSGSTSALGDGIMIFRYLTKAFPEQALIDKAIDANSPYYPSNWNGVATNIENLMV